jgi:hypothetical protein
VKRNDLGRRTFRRRPSFRGNASLNDQRFTDGSSRYLTPSKLALHTTIQRIDEQRRQSGEAAKWEQELVELQENLRQLPQNCHKLIKSGRQHKSENDVTAGKSNRLGA